MAAEPGAADPGPTTAADEDEKPIAETFVNDSAMMIAYERWLETQRGADALVQDPFAKALAGQKGETLSAQFGAACVHFDFTGWPEFHKTWTAVRTHFIDCQIEKLVAERQAEESTAKPFGQFVNLGAGMDMRAYRLDSMSAPAFPNGVFHVDMAVTNRARESAVEKILESPTPKTTSVVNLDLDFLSKDTSLRTELVAGDSGSKFDADAPTMFLAEGLIQYLGDGKLKLIRDVSEAAAPGSVFVLNFLDASEGSQANSPAAAAGLTTAAVRDALGEGAGAQNGGWTDLRFWKFGEDGLNFGRFPLDKFKPSAAWSFVVCVKK